MHVPGRTQQKKFCAGLIQGPDTGCVPAMHLDLGTAGRERGGAAWVQFVKEVKISGRQKPCTVFDGRAAPPDVLKASQWTWTTFVHSPGLAGTGLDGHRPGWPGSQRAPPSSS